MIKNEYNSLIDLVRENVVTEPEDAKQLFSKMQEARKKGFLTKEEFLQICMWKSPRPKKHYLSNSEENINKITKEAFLTSSEELKISFLTSLKGVSIPVASAILTSINPQDYGVIDIRVWQTLHTYEQVETKPKGQGFILSDWIIYLSILRKYAEILKLRARDIEIILFFYHKKKQIGNLYSLQKTENNNIHKTE